jgi:NAD(P)-dependent dehydrogenase (short-subunit alcohol dehydrogenase family)
MAPLDAANDRDLAGRTFLVTGATSGLGHVTARVLAVRGARVYVGGRSLASSEAGIAALRAAVPGATLDLAPFPCDVGDLASVRAAAARLEASGLALDGLVNNAGVAGVRGLAPSGVELIFGVNHLGPFLLTRLLEPALRRASTARVINVASAAHTRVDGIDFAALRRRTRSLTTVREYAVSKLCNVLFARELGRRWSGVTTSALHPGRVATAIWRHAPRPVRWWAGQRGAIGVEEGARTILYCATAHELTGATGLYYAHEREAEPSPAARDDALAARLWTESERLAGLVA